MTRPQGSQEDRGSDANNMQLVKSFWEDVFNGQKYNLIPGLFSENYVLTDDVTTFTRTRADLESDVKAIRANVPDATVTIFSQMANSDGSVVTRLVVTGTLRGPFGRLNAPLHVTTISHFSGGKISSTEVTQREGAQPFNIQQASFHWPWPPWGP